MNVANVHNHALSVPRDVFFLHRPYSKKSNISFVSNTKRNQTYSCRRMWNWPDFVLDRRTINVIILPRYINADWMFKDSILYKLKTFFSVWKSQNHDHKRCCGFCFVSFSCQDYCSSALPTWPPLSALQVMTADDDVSCKKACSNLGMSLLLTFLFLKADSVRLRELVKERKTGNKLLIYCKKVFVGKYIGVYVGRYIRVCVGI